MSLRGTLARVGAPITFTNPSTGAGYDSPTDTMPAPSTPVTVAGFAMGTEGPDEWKQGTNIDIARRRLVFVASTAGQLPERGATCNWAGEDWAVQSVDATAMNGVAMGAFVDLQR